MRAPRARPATAGVGLFLALIGIAGASRAPGSDLPRVVPNDNRTAAGTARGDTVVLDLVVQPAIWYPEAADGPSLTVPAFGEVGKAPSIPAPLIRVVAGTPIRASIRNALPDSTLHLIGFGTQPNTPRDTVRVAPGATVTVTFRAGAPGTYLYRAVIGHKPDDADEERETAGGAFVVDPPGGSPPDRVFVMNIYAEQVDSGRSREALAINGRSWPHTERIAMTVGDTARWRILNNTTRPHPMHLHGFYFRIDETGTGLASRTIPAADRVLAVTEQLARWTTRTISWSPDRPGNWLFHCHLTFHVIPDARLDHRHGPDVDIRETTSINPMQHMAGLVLGMAVSPGPGAAFEPAPATRQLDLFVNEGGPRGRMPRTFSYILQRGPTEPGRDSVEIPGSLLVLTRNERTDITVHNRATEPVAIHWHGLELESWSDGVAGWSGMGTAVAPPVLPDGHFTARLSVPRAGTFIYHTHLNDIEQVTGGAIGPLLVMEPGARYDPTRDHVYIGGWAGLEDETSPGCVPPASGPACGPRLMINGDTLGLPPIELEAGVKHRFRFINLGPAINIRYALRRDTTVVEWLPLARDGADLPMTVRIARPALQSVAVGQTWDFEVTPKPGEWILTASPGNAPITWRRRLVFR